MGKQRRRRRRRQRERRGVSGDPAEALAPAAADARLREALAAQEAGPPARGPGWRTRVYAMACAFLFATVAGCVGLIELRLAWAGVAPWGETLARAGGWLGASALAGAGYGAGVGLLTRICGVPDEALRLGAAGRLLVLPFLAAMGAGAKAGEALSPHGFWGGVVGGMIGVGLAWVIFVAVCGCPFTSPRAAEL